MKIFSVDLASKRYRDFGWAILEVGSGQPSFPTYKHLGLSDPPDAATCAQAVHQYCLHEQVGVILLDGPQAWRHPKSPIEHMRLCERVLNTPGKTGLPGQVKPKTYLHYITFSIDLFRELLGMGWALLREEHFQKPIKRLVIESFPSSSWQTLGLEKLPAKGRIKTHELEPFRKSLARATGYKLPKQLTHDQLQAAVVLPMGEALTRADRSSLVMAGIDPIVEEGQIYEGWIPLPLRR